MAMPLDPIGVHRTVAESCLTRNALLLKIFDPVLDGSGQRFNIVQRIVQSEAGTCRGRNTQSFMQDHRAVVTVTRQHGSTIQHDGQILGMHIINTKTNDCSLVITWNSLQRKV